MCKPVFVQIFFENISSIPQWKNDKFMDKQIALTKDNVLSLKWPHGWVNEEDNAECWVTIGPYGNKAEALKAKDEIVIESLEPHLGYRLILNKIYIPAGKGLYSDG